jgi:hypothetical protein
MKTYYYSLDEKNRITALSLTPWLEERKEEEVVKEQPSIQLETDVGFILGFYGVNENGKIYEIGFDQEYIDSMSKEDKINKIKKLKMFLSDSDWKVIVNSELIQAGLSPKYPDLHEERQAWRDDINDLEAEILFLGLE